MTSTAQSRHIPLPSKPPNLVKDWEAVNKHLATALPQSVKKIQQAVKGEHVSSHDSVYTGLTGIAFMEYHLSNMSLPLMDEVLTPKVLLSSADKHLARVLRHHPGYAYSPSRLSFSESSSGIATLVLARGLSTSEESIINNWQAAKDYLQATIEQVILEDSEVYSPGNKEDASEVLYGRAGLLYALLYLRKAIESQPQQGNASLQSLVSDAKLAKLVDSIVSRGMHGAFSLSSEFRLEDRLRLPPLMWTWHGKRYLGGAHGVAGILQVLLSCPGSVINKHMQDIFGTISWLIDCQDEVGNWPSKCPTQRGASAHNDLIQWCHGAPGMVILLSTALRVLRSDQQSLTNLDSLDKRIRRSLECGASLIYKNGLLRKGTGLCHGVAGSVYALLAASDALDTTSKREFFTKAAHLAFLATLYEDLTSSGEMSVPDHPWSLYEGLSGACCAWAEVLCRMDAKDPRRVRSGFPGFDDLLGS